MTEQIARVVYYFAVHLLYASLVWSAAWVLTTLIRGSATTKYWIWVAASLNFMLPVGALLDQTFAMRLAGARPLRFVGTIGLDVAEKAVLMGALWLVGALLMSTRLVLRLRAEQREAGLERALDVAAGFVAEGFPVKFGRSRQAPAVNGLLHSQILLPEGIDRLLTRGELNAVLTHEIAHAKRRDNLIRLIHEAGLCLLWFHPMMWFSGGRLNLYRELSCDERVIRSAQGADLVSALAKLSSPGSAFLLQSSATPFIGLRLSRLAAPARARVAANGLLVALFAVAGVAGVYSTVMHTACCFILRR
jgi:beta-lactamase regulating signal transducer with metallopeptidase domain